MARQARNWRVWWPSRARVRFHNQDFVSRKCLELRVFKTGKATGGNLEKFCGHFVDCSLTERGARAEANSTVASAGRPGSARLPDGQRGPHRARAERIPGDPEHRERHAEHSEERGAPC